MKITFPFSIFVIFFNNKNKLCPWSQTGTEGESRTPRLQKLEGKSGNGVFLWKWLSGRAIAKQENNK